MLQQCLCVFRMYRSIVVLQLCASVFAMSVPILALLRDFLGLPTWGLLLGFNLALVLWLVGSCRTLAIVRRREGVAQFLGVVPIPESESPREVFALGDGIRLIHYGVCLLGLLVCWMTSLASFGEALGFENVDERSVFGSAGMGPYLLVPAVSFFALFGMQMLFLARVEDWYQEVRRLVVLPELSPSEWALVQTA